ncbi:MAG TPA: DUF4234 domain-containing protein [Acidimicrobiales bacterium]|nr:DUF4234 domain-containing protein [Acidimicrobiales bacterium]
MASTPGSALSGQGLTGKRRNPVLVWLVWPLITLGIYHLYWWYKINDEARRLDPSINVNPLLSLLALFPGGLIIVPPFVTVYRTGGRIRSMQQAAGTPPSVLPIIGLLLMFVFSTYSLYYQISLNGIWTAYGNQPENTPVAIKS